MTQIYGYSFGMRQPAMEVALSFDAPPRLNLGRLDQWLKDYFKTEVPPLATVWSVRGAASLQLTSAPQLLARVLAIYGMLCRAGELPCPEPGRIVKLKSRGTQWQASLLVPTIQTLPPSIFQELARNSLVLAHALLRAPPSLEQAQQIYSKLDQRIVNHCKQLVPGGRATSLVAGLARKLDIPFEYLGMGLLQLGHGGKSQITRRSSSRDDSAIGARICTDKANTALILRQAGLPTPSHQLVLDAAAAAAAAEQLGWPVVVKPSNLERGEGVTIDIHNTADLIAAYDRAKSLSPRILVEKQVPGVCHRVFIVNGQLLYASLRLPKSVKGDGKKTVRQLVDDANAAEQKTPPWSRKKPFPLDALALACLAKAGLTPETIPADGQDAPLRPFTSDEWGGSAKDVTPQVHPENVRLAVRAAELLGLSVAGVDLMTEDITRPWHETGAIINEVNYTPYLGGALEDENAGAYLLALVQASGRIPIHAVIGDQNIWAKAREVRQQLAERGVQAHLCGSAIAESPDGDRITLACQGLFRHCTALLRTPDVDALVIVLDTPEFLSTGLPLDRIDELHTTGEPLPETGRQLLELLSPFCPAGEPAPQTAPVLAG